jgi:hypothetical protein
MPQLVELEAEFVERHGKAWIPFGGGRLFPDGATIDGLGYRSEPPTDAESLLKLRHIYHSAKLAKAETAFRLLKAALLGGDTYNWDEKEFGETPDEYCRDGKSALLKLRGIAEGHRAALEQIEEEQSQLPEEIAKRQRIEENRLFQLQMQEARRKERAEIESIEL